jgi:hypothetical protein
MAKSAYGKKIRSLWGSQKQTSKLRGIEFKFSLDEWVIWWVLHLGVDWHKKRGCRRGQYVMARKFDQGAYEWGNVECILCEDNHSYRNRQREDWGRKMNQAKMRKQMSSFG